MVLQWGSTGQRPAVQPLQPEEMTRLQGCFPWTLYYLQQVEYHPQGLICRGQLRTPADRAYASIAANIRQQFGQRFCVRLQQGQDEKPFFALVPNPQGELRKRLRPTTQEWNTLVTLLLTTALTTSLVGAQLAGFDLSRRDLSFIPAGLPYSLALLAILLSHELGHFATAWFYGVRASLPYFIPFPWLPGTLGAYVRMHTPIPHRRALFDIALAGPVVGLAVSLPLLVWGLLHSQPVAPAGPGLSLSPEHFTPQVSTLLAGITRLVLCAQTTPALHLHPIAVAGCIGLAVTAFNLLPIGRLDGGHLIHAMVGQRPAATIGVLTKWLLLLLAWTRQPWLFVGVILLFLVPSLDEPALNDVTDLDHRRDALGLVALASLILLLLPAPAFLLGGS